MMEFQYSGKPYPMGNRNGKMNPLYSAWEVCDEVDDIHGESEFYQECTFASKQKCESLDERNIVVSCHLLADKPSDIENMGRVTEEHKGGDLRAKTLLPVRSSNKALKEHKNKPLDMPSIPPFHKKSPPAACKQCTGPNLHPTSLGNSRVKSLMPLTQRVLSATCAEPRKEMTFEKNQEISRPAHQRVSAGGILAHKAAGQKTRASGKFLDMCPKSVGTRGPQRARSLSGNVPADEARPVSQRTASLGPGHEGVQARHICASWQKEFGMTLCRLRDCGWGPGGYCLRLCHADYGQPIYSGVRQGRILPSTHLYLWERASRESSQQAGSLFRPFMWKREGDEKGATGPSGHPADSQPDCQAARPKDIRCQSMQQQNPEPPQTDHDFTLKHILQALHCR